MIEMDEELPEGVKQELERIEHEERAVKDRLGPMMDNLKAQIQKRQRVEIIRRLGAASVERGANRDSLGIVPANYFQTHWQRPEPDEAEEGEEDDSGWSPWVLQKTNEALDYIVEQVDGNDGH